MNFSKFVAYTNRLCYTKQIKRKGADAVTNLNTYFQKHGLCAENILYIYRRDRKTVIKRMDGEEFALFIPISSILAVLPECEFLNISKGTVVCRSHIVNISSDGVYTMSDGCSFQGRKRDLSSHRRLRTEMRLEDKHTSPLNMLEKCSLLDNMPLAFCVIELVFNEDGRGVDFIFRYCNAEMEKVEGVPVEEMLNRSFYEVFRNGDKKWLVSYADVALNGTKHTIHDYSPEIDKNLIIHCYQPEPGYCACVLQVVDS